MSSKAYGRRPPKNAPAIRFGAIKATLPSFPDSYDAIKGHQTDWQMLHNDQWGDCVVVTYFTLRRICSWIVGRDDYPPSDDDILAIYRTQNPGFDPNDPAHGAGSADDAGMDIQTLLEYLHTTGYKGVKAVAFAKVDHTSNDELKAALYTLGALWLGVVVTGTNERQFDQGIPWTINPGDQVLGGHSITGVGYQPDTYLVETWAKEAPLSTGYVDGQGVEEAWAVIWPEHVALMNDAQKATLAAEYKAITGQDIQWPDTPPAPVPEPTPTPQPTPEPTPQPPAPNDPPNDIESALQQVIHHLRQAIRAIERFLS